MKKVKKNKILEKLKAGMVVCFESDGGFIDRRIVAYQKKVGFDVAPSLQTHIGIAMGGPYIVEATYPRSRAANILTEYQGRKMTFLYLRGQRFRELKRKNVVIWAATRCNLKYGWPALLGFYLVNLVPLWGSNPLSSKRTPFCSHLAAWAFRRVGFDPFPGISTDLITPAHFYSSTNFEKLKVRVTGEGALLDY